MLAAVLAVTSMHPGGPDVLGIEEVAEPVPGPAEVLVDVAAAGVNRADLLQREGKYPPPTGASPYLGLECSGRISAVGVDVSDWHVGDEVCALLAGGGYAERVAVPHEQLMPVPTGVSIVDAAALPEVTCTVWSNLVMLAGLSRGESVLVHGGGSGIGTMAIQLASLVGARSFVTCGSRRKVDACLALGAEAGINYREQEWGDGLRAATEGRGVDVILDVVGAKYLPANLRALSRGGRLVVIGLQGGRTGELDLGRMLAQRLSVHGTTLRSLSPAAKGEIVDAVVSNVWPALSSGRVRPVVDRVLPWTDAAEAHRVLEAGENIGKVLLRVGDGHGNGGESGDGSA